MTHDTTGQKCVQLPMDAPVGEGRARHSTDLTAQSSEPIVRPPLGPVFPLPEGAGFGPTGPARPGPGRGAPTATGGATGSADGIGGSAEAAGGSGEAAVDAAGGCGAADATAAGDVLADAEAEASALGAGSR